MKTALFSSGFMASLFIVLGLIGLVSPWFDSQVFMVSGAILAIAVYLPILLLSRRRHSQKIQEIIRDHAGKEKEKSKSESGSSAHKGWSMNASPFRSRKSGLNWGGGNVHAAGASRGERKSFGR